MRKWKNLRKKEDGVTLIIIALSMTAILSMMALVLDLGLAFYNRAQLQASCDAAALAAARYMNDKSGPTEATLTQNGINCFSQNYSAADITKYSIKNPDAKYKYSRSDISSIKNDTVETWASMESPTGFARIFGVNSIKINVMAEAICTQIPSPESIWAKALVSNEKLVVSGKNPHFGSIHSNEGINFGGIANVTVDGAISSGTGNVSNIGANFNGTSTITKKEYDILAASNEMLNYVKDNYKTNPDNFDNQITARPNFYGETLPNKWKKSGSTLMLDGEIAYIGNEFSKGNPLQIEGSSGSKILINHNLYITGSVNFAQHVTIQEGYTVYVTGNCQISQGIYCDGNLIVMGSMNVNGGRFETSSSKNSNVTSYVYVGGTSVNIGTCGSLCDNVLICAPNCEQFSINGGDTIFKGSIIGNNLSDIGSGHIEVYKPDSEYPFHDKIDVMRLTK